MLKRLKNLVEISKYKPEQLDEKVVLKKNIEEKPRGKATVVQDEPMDLFPNEPEQNDQTS